MEVFTILKEKNKRFILFVTLILLVFFATACGENNNNTEKASNNDNKNENEEEINYSSKDNPIVTLTMENGGEIIIELYPEVAPNTVNNFISLIENNFYDGLVFHRVLPEFMIQGGDPDGDGTGGAEYAIKGEFKTNQIENNLNHRRGVLSMARSQKTDSASSQFFIVVEDSSHLNGKYAGFGKVIEGMEVADEIVETDRDRTDKPLKEQRIETMTVDKKGKNYPEPEKE